VSKTKALVVAGLLLFAGAARGAEPGQPIPPGGRVGIIDLMRNDVTHFHVGADSLKSFLRTYSAPWSVADVIDEPLIWALTNAGLEPVSLQPSELLHRQRQSWIVANPQSTRLARACLEELERTMTQERLEALIIVAPGENTAPESVEGNRLRELPDYVQGWGVSTSDEPEGIVKPVVFNLTQMLLIEKAGDDGARLEYREWGGSYVYEWTDFTPPTDLKVLPGAEIAKLKPVIADVMKRQITRLMPHLQP
jgi:hypothetical protein